MLKTLLASSIFCVGLAQNVQASPFQSSIQNLPKSIKKQMQGTTWHKGCPVSLSQLAYLKLSYWGFDNKPHVGTLIVNKQLAENTVNVFKKLYEQRFPIESMNPMYFFHGNDNASMQANNSS